mmetsp:Transcript_30374/g.65419  ORF Transcript_30374/g.65419 Transcript_30374/m.65419 type:complete len:530 (+) Transcript_30374:144-1733(+)
MQPVGIAAVINANQDMICMAKGDDVRTLTIAQLLQRKLAIPIFQRRYCWSEDQWRVLWSDVQVLVAGGEERHALGRLTCAIREASEEVEPTSTSPAASPDLLDGGDRVLVIDGQQRNTTVLLLLAALRDCAARKETTTGKNLEQQLNRVLYPDEEALREWLLQRVDGNEVVLHEGHALPTATLLPTYCDRAPFFAATLPALQQLLPDRQLTGVRLASGEAAWQRPLLAKKFFLERASNLSDAELCNYASCVLHKLQWLFFPIDIGHDRKDGTENLQVVFERLALREQMVVGPSRRGTNEAANMGAADFVRNLLLGSFQREADAIDAYRRFWLPVEAAAGEASGRGSLSVASTLEAMLDAFLKEQKKLGPTVKATPGLYTPIGGAMYSRFRQWLATWLSADAANLDESEVVERRTLEALEILAKFSSRHFGLGNSCSGGINDNNSSQQLENSLLEEEDGDDEEEAAEELLAEEEDLNVKVKGLQVCEHILESPEEEEEEAEEAVPPQVPETRKAFAAFPVRLPHFPRLSL